jgi:hypothetical protein
MQTIHADTAGSYEGRGDRDLDNSSPRRKAPARDKCQWCGQHPATSFDYVRHAYGVPASRGMRVTVGGKGGVITRGRGAHLGIRLDGETRADRYHPTSQITYHAPGGDYTPETRNVWLGRGDEMWGRANL